MDGVDLNSFALGFVAGIGAYTCARALRAWLMLRALRDSHRARLQRDVDELTRKRRAKGAGVPT